jgi:membrane-associated protease RseP (regulator of RpoE activity)
VDPAEPFPVPPSSFVWRPRPKYQDRRWLHALLFLLTIGTTALAGGWAYSATVLAILGCHELGHYLACRYYDVDASLPFFLPFPPVISLSGTIGAFIRIREPIPYKRWLFDIGIAGPIAGFLVAVPAILVGVAWSTVQTAAPNGGLILGDPLLIRFAQWLYWPSMSDSQTLVLHPVAFAGWVGLLVTALNLFPIGQLDGGHISYAVLGHRSTYVTIATLGAAIALSFRSPSWIVWTVLMLILLSMFGVRHPRVIDEDVPLDRSRQLLAIVAAVIFAVCFTPVPISPFDLIGR